MHKQKQVVRGPQLKLKGRGFGKARGKDPERHARVRYVEPPHKVTGNPFVAVRVPRELHRAFLAHCRKRKSPPAAVLRAYMARVTGVSASSDGDE